MINELIRKISEKVKNEEISVEEGSIFIKRVLEGGYKIENLNIDSLVTIDSNASDKQHTAEKDNCPKGLDQVDRVLAPESVEIAIIGISGRFPEARNVNELWKNISRGVDSVKEITRWNTDEYFDPNPQTHGKSYSKWGGFLDDIDRFDPMFFNISPRESELTDPQQRLFMQEAWKALEDAGYSDRDLSGRKCGVFVGVGPSDYLKLMNDLQMLPEAYTFMGNSESILAARISYFLNLKGPSIAIDTACSSSLVAIHLACESIKCGTSEMAITGGISLMPVPDNYVMFSSAGMLSPDGCCKAFDHRANGFVPGEGAGAVILKRLDFAVRDKDNIYGVIEGSGLNQDGKTNGITAPSTVSQTELECEVYNRYNINPEEISYIETHGTGTKLGDPIEIDALTDAFGRFSDKKQFCAVGSIKSNIGHTLMAAGAASVIKVLLCLKHKKLVPSLHVEKENGLINFKDSPFYVNTEFKDWKPSKGSIRKAAVSSFGFSGTNAHLVIREFDAGEIHSSKAQGKPYYIIPVSAKTENALKRKLEELYVWLGADGSKRDIRDISYTLMVGRSHFSYRSLFIASSLGEIKEQILKVLESKTPQYYSKSILKDMKSKIDVALKQQGERLLAELGNEDMPDGEYLKKLVSLADLYIKGYEFNWKVLYSRQECAKISMPVYPFEEGSYWVKAGDEDELPNGRNTRVLHPLVHENISNLREQKYLTALSENDFYVRDHIVAGQKILPGAVYVEMVRAAGELASESRVRQIRNIIWSHPVVVSDCTYKLQTSLYPNGGVVEFEVASNNGVDQTLHAQGELVLEDINAVHPKIQNIDIKAVTARCRHTISGQECYSDFKNMGFEYRTAFQTIDRLYLNKEEALALLRVPGGVSTGNFMMHPSLLDGALQSVVGLLSREVRDGKVLYLPFSIGEVLINSPLNGECYSYVVAKDGPGKRESGTAKFDILITDTRGSVLAAIRDFTLRAALHERGSGTPILYFTERWEKEALPLAIEGMNKDCAVIFCNDKNIVSAFKGKGLYSKTVHVRFGDGFSEAEGYEFTINPECEEHYPRLLKALEEKGIVPQDLVFFSNHELSGKGVKKPERILETLVYPLFFLCRTLVGAGLKGRVLNIYLEKDGETVPYNNAIGGLASSIQKESRNLRLTAVGVALENYKMNRQTGDMLVDIILRELACETGNRSEIRYVNNERYVRKIEELEPKEESGQPEFKDEGVYLIVGGFGGLGTIFAWDIAQKTKAKIVIAGRSELKGALSEKFEELRKVSPEIMYIRSDMTKHQEVVGLVSKIKSLCGRLDGIIYCAGVLRDSYLGSKTREDLDTVIHTKVCGAVWLDEETAGEKLDFFVMFSSIAAFLGNAGQTDYAYANSFLNKFALLREILRKEGKRNGRTYSINWPLWENGGMKVDSETQKLYMSTIGARLMDAQSGTRAFSRALGLDSSQVAVFKGDGDKIRRLLLEGLARPEAGESAAGGGTDEETLVKSVNNELIKGVSKILKIDEKEIDTDIEISQFGFDSISLTELSNYLNKIYGITVMPSDFFEYSTLAEFSKYMVKEFKDRLSEYHKDIQGNVRQEQSLRAMDQTAPKNYGIAPIERAARMRGVREHENEPVAIIGISTKMPQSEDVDEFWSNLAAGRDMVTEIPKDRWDWKKYYGDPLREPNKTNIKWGGFMKDADKFDAAFFEISPIEAQLMDPQQRVFLETVWKAVEDAGYNVSELSGSNTGLFVGGATWDYSEQLALRGGDIQAHTSTGMAHSILANRISYLLNLHGPSEPVDTACSSALVAIYRAAEALRYCECDMAIAGGVNVISSPTLYISFSKAGMLSKDGRCKTFDKDANGYIRGEGAGAVILKTLSRAKADGDHIYAVIKGMALNHGGHANSLTAPNPNAQAELIETAWKRAGIKPTRATYIEAHGTGTSLGDPIEINGLKKAFEQLYSAWNLTGIKQASCGIGSVKTNIGHLEAAAGIAGIIKLVLAMKHGMIPGNLHFKELNPYIKLEGSPFYIVNKNTPWEPERDEQNMPVPRCAGISSFGFGGMNAHIVLEEYMDSGSTLSNIQNSPQVIVLSARNEDRLKAYAKNISSFLDRAFNTDCECIDLSGTILDDLTNIAAKLMNVDAKDIDAEDNLLECGMDHMGISMLAGEINRKYGIEISDRLLFERGSIAAASVYLEKNFASLIAANYSTPSAGETIKLSTANISLADIAYTLQTGRKPMEERIAFIAGNIDELKEKFERYANGEKEFEGLYKGSIKTAKAKSSLLVEGKAGEEFIKAIIAEKDYDKLAYLWVNGVQIDWKTVHKGQHSKKVSLPTYPFERKRYWIPEGECNGLQAGEGRISLSIHPMLDENVSDLQSQSYRKSFTGKEFYLTDHLVDGIKILPGVAHLEMARAAGSLAGKRNIKCLRNIAWLRPLTVSKGTVDAYISLYPSGKNAMFEIEASTGNGGRITCSQGEICFEDREDANDEIKSISIEDIKGRCNVRINSDEFYSLFEGTGINYGSSFRVIKELSIGDDEVFSRISLSDECGASAEGFGLHPAILDGAFQSVLGMVCRYEGKPSCAYLPYNLQKISIYKEVPGECCVHVRLSSAASGTDRRVLRFDIDVADMSGCVCVMVENLAIMQLGEDSTYEAGSGNEDWCAEVQALQAPSTATEDEAAGPDVDEIAKDALTKNLEKDLVHIICDILGLEEKEIDDENEFSRFGFDSITLSQFSTRISDKYNISFLPSQLFELPNLRKLSEYLAKTHWKLLTEHYRGKVKTVRKREKSVKAQPGKEKNCRRFIQYTEAGFGCTPAVNASEYIAIIGMSGVFPQSRTLEEYWNNLVAGRDMVGEIPADRWDWRQYYGDPVKDINKTNVIWGGFMNDVDKFDPTFFGISPKEAELMDPQQRIFLETVWKTVEDAGYRTSSLAGTKTGLFVGVGASDYYELLKDSCVDVQAQTSTGAAHSILANRISFLLDIHGPSEPIDTACSSSLIAIHRAVESIRNGDCDMAIAGGVNVIARPTYYISFGKAGFLSQDGKCKTFDKDANGYVRGEGCGAIMLKRLSRAQADRDHIYAVVKSSSINHGGRANSLTAPNPNAQAELIVSAWKKAGIDPSTVSYIESHGTGTSLGDPIEINGLKKAFEQLYKDSGKKIGTVPHCGIGAVKTNIGHLETASGIAGIIKTLLSMKHGMIPGNLHFNELNPYIKLEGSPFYLISKNTEWERLKDNDGRPLPRRAGISSFGFGGVNAHITIEEYKENEEHSPASEGTPYVYVLSAKNDERLKAYCKELAQFLENQSSKVSLKSVAYTLQVGRDAMAKRFAVVTDNIEDLKKALLEFYEGKTDMENVFSGSVKNDRQKTGVVLEGRSGKEFVGMLVDDKTYVNLAKLWVLGLEIDWDNLYSGDIPERISIPTYPFTRGRYWVPERKIKENNLKPVERISDFEAAKVSARRKSLVPKSAEKQGVQGDNNSIYYMPVWKPVCIEAGGTGKMSVEASAKTVIIYTRHADRLCETLCGLCPDGGFVRIRLGTKNIQFSQSEWEVNMCDSGAFSSCIESIGDIGAIYFLGGIQGTEIDAEDNIQLEENQQAGALSLFRLVKELENKGYSKKTLKLTVVTNNINRVLPDDMVIPCTASLVGITKSLSREYPAWSVALLDIDLNEINNDADGLALTAAVRAIVSEPGEPKAKEVAIRGQKRYVRLIESVELPLVESSRFKKNGVYMILGGAGGIGLELAMYLSKAVQANLVLMGRSKLDAARLDKIAQIEAKGGKILYLRADANDLESMKAAVVKARERFGRIDGVIHSAIVLKDKLIANMDEKEFRIALDTKVAGSLNLYKAIEDEKPEFIMFFSSAQSFAGNAGQSNYAAGCTFKDAFAYYLDRKCDTRVQIVNWGYWGSVGIVANEEYNRRLNARGIASINSEEGFAALERVLGNHMIQVMPIKADKQLLKTMGADLTKKRVVFPQNMPAILDTAMDSAKQPIPGDETLARLEVSFKSLKRFAHLLLLKTFRDMGVFIKAGERYEKLELKETLKFIPKYGRLYDEFIDILHKAGFAALEGNTITTSPNLEADELEKELQTLEEMKKYLESNYPAVSVHVNLLWTCSRRFEDIFTGKVKATDIMFPNSSMELVEGIYRDNDIADYYNELVVWSVLSYLETRKASLVAGDKIKILEIGAGTGGTSAPLFKAINKYKDHIVYTYTDISMAFTHYGRQQFGVQNPFIEFKILNIENDIKSQNYTPGSYDIIIATNVLHATKNIRNALRNMKNLLKSNGWAVINEITHVQDVATMTFGLLDGWWLYEDEENRIKGSPLLKRETWEVILKEEGFGRLEALGVRDAVEGGMVHNVFAAQSDGIVEWEADSGHFYEEMSAPVEPTVAVYETLHDLVRENEIFVQRKTLYRQKDTTDETEIKQSIEDKITGCLAEVLKLDMSEFDCDLPFTDFGIDSILAIEVVDKINEKLAINLKSTDLFNYSTIARLAEHIAENFGSILVGEENDTDKKANLDESPPDASLQAEEDDTVMNMLSMLEDGELDIDDVEKALWG